MFSAIEMRTKAHAFVGDFTQFGKAKDLIATGVREYGARPRHELVQAAKLADQLVARAQIKMIGVGEDDFRAKFFEGFLRQGFDGSLCANGHEEGRLDGAMRRGQAATARASRIGLRNFERKIHLQPNTESWTGRNACPTSVYQEKMKAQPTRHTAKAAHMPKAMVKDLAPFNFFGFTAAKPMARRISVQKVKRSIDLPRATSHLAESSGSSAARFAATGLSRSAVPYGFK